MGKADCRNCENLGHKNKFGYRSKGKYCRAFGFRIRGKNRGPRWYRWAPKCRAFDQILKVTLDELWNAVAEGSA